MCTAHLSSKPYENTETIVGRYPVTSSFTKSKESANAIFSLFNLGSSSRSAIIEPKLRNLRGIDNAVVNYVADTVSVNYDPEQLTTKDIRTFIRKCVTKSESQIRVNFDG